MPTSTFPRGIPQNDAFPDRLTKSGRSDILKLTAKFEMLMRFFVFPGNSPLHLAVMLGRKGTFAIRVVAVTFCEWFGSFQSASSYCSPGMRP